MSIIGLNTIYDNISFLSETNTASIPESTIPRLVLGDLSINVLGRLELTRVLLVSLIAIAAY